MLVFVKELSVGVKDAVQILCKRKTDLRVTKVFTNRLIGLEDMNDVRKSSIDYYHFIPFACYLIGASIPINQAFIYTPPTHPQL